MVWQSRRTPLCVLVAVLGVLFGVLFGATASANPPSMNDELRKAMTATLNAGSTAPGDDRARALRSRRRLGRRCQRLSGRPHLVHGTPGRGRRPRYARRQSVP